MGIDCKGTGQACVSDLLRDGKQAYQRLVVKKQGWVGTETWGQKRVDRSTGAALVL